MELVSGRTCSGCTACCKTHAVAEIKKDEGVWCEYCDIGVGCKRYEDRPGDCKIFSCAWLVGMGTASERPDKSKVVCGVSPFPDLGDTCTIHEMRPGACETSALAEEWKRTAMSGGLAVWIRRDQTRDTLLIPEAMVLSLFVQNVLKSKNVAVHRYRRI